MGATTTTPNVHLPQFADTDKPTWRGDVNSAFGTIDTELAARYSRADTDALLNGKVDRSRVAVNIRDYGAVGDGITDDRAAIQAALDAAGMNGIVRVPRGTFNVKTGTITIGTPVTAIDRILKVYPGQTIIGDSDEDSVIRVGNNIGNYKGVFGFATDATYGHFSMRNVQIDHNSVNNPIDYANRNTYPRNALRLGSYNDTTSRISVKDCAFSNVDAVNTIYVYGRLVQIRGCTFMNVGGTVTVSGGNTLSTQSYDHSTIYATITVADGALNICNNDFFGVAAGAGARTAIETHGGMQVVNNNNVVNYFKGVNLTGVNISLAANTNLVCRGATVSNNMFSRVAIGVHVWSWYQGGTTTGPNMMNVLVNNNTVDIDRDNWSGLTGISQYANGVIVDQTNTAPIHGLSITNNRIRYRPSTFAPASDYNSAGICIIVANAAAVIYDLLIANNTINDPLSTGINLSVTGGIIRGEIANNTVVNPGSSADATMADLYKSFCVPQKLLTNVSFHDNRLYDDRAAHVAQYGMQIGGTAGVFTNVRSFNNYVSYADGTTPRCFVTPLASGSYMWIDEPADVAALPGSSVKVGSRITELSTGKVYVQVTAPQGLLWKLNSDVGVTTTTSAVGGAATALPGAPVGYETRNVNGADQKFPYYG